VKLVTVVIDPDNWYLPKLILLNFDNIVVFEKTVFVRAKLE